MKWARAAPSVLENSTSCQSWAPRSTEAFGRPIVTKKCQFPSLLCAHPAVLNNPSCFVVPSYPSGQSNVSRKGGANVTICLASGSDRGQSGRTMREFCSAVPWYKGPSLDLEDSIRSEATCGRLSKTRDTGRKRCPAYSRSLPHVVSR